MECHQIDNIGPIALFLQGETRARALSNQGSNTALQINYKSVRKPQTPNRERRDALQLVGETKSALGRQDYVALSANANACLEFEPRYVT